MLPEQELVEALARIDELEAEVEKRSYENHLLNEDLKTEAAQLFERAVDKDNYEERIGELEAENKALREFTHHRTACSFFAQRPCSCGLTALLEAEK